MGRAFRIFRLFRRVESMRRVVASILHGVPGVLNAFLINFTLICIYAVLAVDFFGFVYDQCKEENFEGPAAMKTARDKCWGYDYYGSFTRSLYTMFQVLTGESWSEAAARPALTYFLDQDDYLWVFVTYCFFYSFVIINSFVLLNVVVAVLMDGMNKSAPAPPEKVRDDGQFGTPTLPDGVPSDLRQVIANLQTQLKAQSVCMDGIMKELTELKELVKYPTEWPAEST